MTQLVYASLKNQSIRQERRVGAAYQAYTLSHHLIFEYGNSPIADNHSI